METWQIVGVISSLALLLYLAPAVFGAYRRQATLQTVAIWLAIFAVLGLLYTWFKE